MIYLIGGAPRCGKTILSKKISQRKKISLFSTDILRPIILSYTKKSDYKKKFPYEVLKVPKNKYAFEVYAPKQLLEFEITEATSMWPGVKSMMMQLVDMKQDYIIEGVHLLPKHIAQLKRTRYWRNIKIFYLIKTNKEDIISGLPKNRSEFDWLLQGIGGDKKRIALAADMIKEKSDYFKIESRKFKFQVIDTGKDFSKKIDMLAK